MAAAVAEVEHKVGDKGPFGRMWDGEKFAKPAKEAVPAATAGLDAATLAALIKQSVAEATAPLEDKIRRLETQGPAQFKRMDPTLGQDFAGAERQAVKSKRFAGSGGEESLPLGTDGHPVPDHVLKLVPQRFAPGQAVRIRRDVIRNGMRNDMTWGELMDKLGTVRCPTRNGNKQCGGRVTVGSPCPVCGEGPKVLKIGFLNETVGDWVLKVRVPGLTTSYGMGFYSQELEAA